MDATSSEILDVSRAVVPVTPFLCLRVSMPFSLKNTMELPTFFTHLLANPPPCESIGVAVPATGLIAYILLSFIASTTLPSSERALIAPVSSPHTFMKLAFNVFAFAGTAAV